MLIIALKASVTIIALEWICKIITSKVKALNGADVCNYAQFGQAGFWAKDSRQAA